MPELAWTIVVGNSKSVSASPKVSRAIWDALVRVGERHGAVLVASTECADFDVRQKCPAWAQPVQKGDVGSPQSALAAYVRRGANFTAQLDPVTDAAKSPEGNTRARGVLRIVIDGQLPVDVVHAPWQPEDTRDDYNKAVARLVDELLIGDWNEQAAAMRRLVGDRQLLSDRLIHAVIPAGLHAELIEVVPRKRLHRDADHEALVIRVTRRTAPVVTTPKPTQPTPAEPHTPPSKEPTMKLPDNLPKILRDAGLKVVEVDGWKERGVSGSFDPVGVLCHHTATSKSSTNTNVVNLLVKGRSDLKGPLCQLGLSRDGTVYIVAAGRANHAGDARASGTVAAGNGNTLYIGIEAFNDGVGEPWPSVQYDAYALLAATLSTEITGNSAQTVRAHKETSVTGKIDVRFPMDPFRAKVDKIMAGGKPAEPAAPKLNKVQKARVDLAESIAELDRAIVLLGQVEKDRTVVLAQIKPLRDARAELNGLLQKLPES